MLSSFIDLSKASTQQLESLSQACDPATFGVNNQDVLDETYRKAGKLDTSNFSTKFSVERSGLLNFIRGELLEGQDVNKAMDVELYKLNVYGRHAVFLLPCTSHPSLLAGKESFFKSHQDTPRGPNMFGSLVIVFPTPHEGGALILRHEEKEWTFDSANELSQQSEPSISYVAFYSDVEHEVALVTSGYRVTITYNLYFPAASLPAVVAPTNHAVSENEAAFQAGLSDLLANEKVLPKGGTLGFGLRHEYPVNAQTELHTLLDFLKGSDAIIKRACKQLSLDVSLKVIYRDNDIRSVDIMTDRFANLSKHSHVESVLEVLTQKKYGGVLVQYVGQPVVERREWDRTVGDVVLMKTLEVFLVTKVTKVTSFKTEFIAYGNEAELAHLYGKVCLIARVGPPGRRTEL